jgi:hypothetical protein
MGSLSNLYISQSYISLLHLGSNNTASTSLTQIEDGLGNGIGIYVNTNGDLANTGNVTVGRSLTVSGSARINTAYTASTPTYVNSGNQFTNNIVRITGSFASGSATSPTVNEVQIGWPVYGPGLISGAVVTNKNYINSQFVELTVNQNTIQWFGNYYFTNPTTFYDNVSVSGSQDITGSLWVRDKITATDISASNSISASNLYVRGRISAYELDVTIESSSIIFTSGSNILGDEANIDTQTLIGRVIVSGSLEVTGSTRINGNTTIIDSLNLTGSLNVTGSMIYSGSVRGNVIPLTIASNTASMDCSLGNFFTLALPTSSTILINPTNILPGETLSLRIEQPSAGTGSVVRLASSIKLSSFNSPYTASTSINSIDIITFISFDSSSLFGSAIKNFN